nr:hypothetical protein Iba_chr05dCG9870 [Ipomoea batatas]
MEENGGDVEAAKGRRSPPEEVTVEVLPLPEEERSPPPKPHRYHNPPLNSSFFRRRGRRIVTAAAWRTLEEVAARLLPSITYISTHRREAAAGVPRPELSAEDFADHPLCVAARKRRTEEETKATGVGVVGRTEENGGDIKAAKVLRYYLTKGEGPLAITACSASSNKTGEKVATRGGYRCVVALAVGGTKSTAEAAPLPQSAAELVVLSSTGKEDRHCRCMENVVGGCRPSTAVDHLYQHPPP